MFDFASIARPHTLAEALEALAVDPEAKVIAGGTDVLIKLRAGNLPAGKLLGCRLVSIHDIPELKGVSMDEDGSIHIGPLTTFTELNESPVILEHIPVLAQAADTVGGPQIRAMGTVGGNISNGVTSADTATTLLNLEAELTISSLSGVRTINVNDYYVSAGRVDLQPGELLTDICIRPAGYRGSSGCYIKYSMRNSMDIATLGISCLIWPEEGDIITTVRLAYGVASPVPMRARKAEAQLQGMSLTEAVECAPQLIQSEINPRDSWRASRDFRLQIAGENTRRALVRAWAAAGRSIPAELAELAGGEK